MQLAEKKKNLTRIVARGETLCLTLTSVQGTVNGSRKDSCFCRATLSGGCLRHKAVKGSILASCYLLVAQDSTDMEATMIKPTQCHPDTSPQKRSSLCFLKDLDSKRWTNRPSAQSFICPERSNCSISTLADCALPSQVTICNTGHPLRPQVVRMRKVVLILLPPISYCWLKITVKRG